MKIWFFFFIYCVLIFSAKSSPLKIAFGSCNDQKDPQPLWMPILKENPNLFIWGGDNIYADSNDPEKIKEAYDIQNENLEYKRFKEKIPMIGIWDDHDFSVDNSRGNYSFKYESQQLFLNFFDESLNSLRRDQEGIYTSYEVGHPDQLVKIILLDNRYFKDLDAEFPLLGKKQWQWLENELRHSKAKLHLIVSGISILAPKIPITEEWADYPSELSKIKKLLRAHQVKAPIFITGDKHFGSIFKNEEFIEIMSSGMTHTVPKMLRPILKRVYSRSFFGLNFGIIEIDWQKNSGGPQVKLMIKNRKSQNMLSSEILWNGSKWKNVMSEK